MARLAVGTEGHERHQVGVVRGDGDQAVVVGGVGRAVVVGEPVEPLRREADRADVVADVATEVLRQLDRLLAELAQPRPTGLVTVDAGPAEVAQRVLEHAGRVGVEPVRVEVDEGGVEVAVQAQVGDELLHLLAHLVGAGADRLVGVHLGPQGQRLRVPDRHLGVVPAVENGQRPLRAGPP